jgi:Ca-activated chloride channel family protein
MQIGKMKKILVQGSLFYDRSVTRLRDPGVLLIVLTLLAVFAMVLFSIVFPEVTKAQGLPGRINEDPWQTKGGQLFFENPDASFRAAALLKTEVDIEVVGIIVNARIRQYFINSSENWMEGIYAFPLPEDAAITSLRMEIGDRQLEGRVKERQTARRSYQKARAEGRKTSLMEQRRPNIFTVSMANIGPGEKVVVGLEYQNTAAYDNGTFSLRFPTAVGPRYLPANGVEVLREDGTYSSTAGITTVRQVKNADCLSPPVVAPGEKAVNPTSIVVNLDTGLPLASIESPYHNIVVEPHADNSQTVVLGNEWMASNRDFVLQWRPEQGAGPQAVLFTEKQGDEAYLLLMLVPPMEDVVQGATSREVVFVLDVSGSMAGASIEQAKEALRLAVQRLANWDSFDIITFNDRARSLFEGPRAATPFTREKALEFIDGLQARGGTQMRDALLLALDNQKDRQQADRIKQVVFLTDGCAANEESLFRTISDRIGENRLFTVGIGSAPNSYFMKNAARVGRGTFTYIGKVQEVQERIEELMVKLESPALTDIAIDLPEGTVYEGSPDPLPDLYLGESLIAVLKTDLPPDRLSLTGVFAGKKWQMEMHPQFAAFQKGISTLWARNRIQNFMDGLQAGVIGEEEVRQQVLAIGLLHHLVSRYTSLVVVDVTPVRAPKEELAAQRMKGNLPEGWQYPMISAVPQTGTIAHMCAVLGAMFVFLSCLLTSLLFRMKKRGADG